MALSVVAINLGTGTKPGMALVNDVVFFDQKTTNAIFTLPVANILLPMRTSVLSYSVQRSSKLTEHTIETGQTIADFKIIEPMRLTCQLAIPALFSAIVIKQIDRYFMSSDKIIIQTKTGVYRDMILESMPVEIDAKTIDRPVFNLSFREVMLVDIDQEADTPPADADAWTDKLMGEIGEGFDRFANPLGL